MSRVFECGAAWRYACTRRPKALALSPVSVVLNIRKRVHRYQYIMGHQLQCCVQGLNASMIGVVPYAALRFAAYDGACACDVVVVDLGSSFVAIAACSTVRC